MIDKFFNRYIWPFAVLGVLGGLYSMTFDIPPYRNTYLYWVIPSITALIIMKVYVFKLRKSWKIKKLFFQKYRDQLTDDNSPQLTIEKIYEFIYDMEHSPEDRAIASLILRDTLSKLVKDKNKQLYNILNKRLVNNDEIDSVINSLSSIQLSDNSGIDKNIISTIQTIILREKKQRVLSNQLFLK